LIIEFCGKENFAMQKNILIADDDKEVLALLMEMIEGEGFKVFLASNGKEAIEIFERNPIDVAILDLKMPFMDGLETLKKIKNVDPLIEVLIMTAYDDLESMREALIVNGAFDYLLKPFHRSEFISTIRNAIAKRELTIQNNLLKEELKTRILQLEKDFE